MGYQESISISYFICGIIFSLTVGVLFNSSIAEIRNRGFRELCRKQNKNLLNKLLVSFNLTTIAFIFGVLGENASLYWITATFEILAAAALVFECCYLMWILKFLRKFNGDIRDCILTEDAERQK